jgi:hypothetical protein
MTKATRRLRVGDGSDIVFAIEDAVALSLRDRGCGGSTPSRSLRGEVTKTQRVVRLFPFQHKDQRKSLPTWVGLLRKYAKTGAGGGS